MQEEELGPCTTDDMAPELARKGLRFGRGIKD